MKQFGATPPTSVMLSPSERPRIGSALLAAAKKHGVSVEDLLRGPNVDVMVALETGKLFTSARLFERTKRGAWNLGRALLGGRLLALLTPPNHDAGADSSSNEAAGSVSPGSPGSSEGELRIQKLRLEMQFLSQQLRRRTFWLELAKAPRWSRRRIGPRLDDLPWHWPIARIAPDAR